MGAASITRSPFLEAGECISTSAHHPADRRERSGCGQGIDPLLCLLFCGCVRDPDVHSSARVHYVSLPCDMPGVADAVHGGL